MTPLKNKRIFYVEDNVPNRALVQLILEQQGATVQFERWGNSLDIFRRLEKFVPVDLILLDLMFPGGVSGYDIFHEIRKHAEYRDVPIAAISASDPSIEMPKARAAGLSGFISKPINMMKFPEQISNLTLGNNVWYAG